ncbi:MAG TPA: FMN-binding protein [Acidimicrobiales bacterium]|nr:FMN-binding protein [Acidimicrobiales bacterium]
MNRAPIVLLFTVAVLVGVFSFHSSPVQISLGTIPVAPTTVTPPTTTSLPATTRTSAPRAATSTTLVHNPPPPPTPTTTITAAPVTTTTVPSSVRQATGGSVNYIFGILSVNVSVTKTKITKVSIAAINDGGNPRSVSIDQYAIPILEKEAVQTQNANIQSVSGASYTSAGFAQSLQSALTQLGL